MLGSRQPRSPPCYSQPMSPPIAFVPLDIHIAAAPENGERILHRSLRAVEVVREGDDEFARPDIHAYGDGGEDDPQIDLLTTIGSASVHFTY
jgi:hypothetical protein